MIGFGGKNQETIKVSDYIEIDSIFAMAWAKVVYPDFYKNVQDYITAFIYREQSISDGNAWKSAYDFESFKTKQYLCFDDGKELLINTSAHRQIKLIFDRYNGDMGLKNPDAGIKYFRPNIEPYEFTTIEFLNLFKDENIKLDQVREFIAKKWKDNRRSVFIDFTNRLKLRPFKLSERFISASALLDLSLRSNHSEARELKKINEEYWRQIVSLFQDKVILSNASKYEVIKNLFTSGGFVKDIFELWEKMTALEINDKITANLSHSTIPNLFYKFFNATDFRDDSANETIENYKFLLDEITNFKFKKPESRVAGV